MTDEQRTWTMSDSARASNPGHVRANLFRWFRHYPKWPLIWFSILALFVALAWFVHWTFWIPATLLLAMNAFYWKQVRERFRYGCALPGVIVSAEPILIAASTDLTKGIGKYPAVKIFETSLATACGRLPQVGTMLPTVAIYRDSPEGDLPHWAEVDPRPVDCVTGDLETVERVMKTFSESDWNELRLWLRQVPRPFKCGLYHIESTE